MKLEQYLNEVGEQEVQKEKEIEVVRNLVVDEICRTYEFWDRSVQRNHSVFDMHGMSCVSLGPNKFKSRDISSFSFFVKNYEERRDFYRVGVFLSALINTSEETDFNLFLGIIKQPIFWVGCFLDGKKVTINGGQFNRVGYGMRSGKIRVTGDLGFQAGDKSVDGEIHVEGKITTISDYCKARVYYRGVQVWPE